MYRSVDLDIPTVLQARLSDTSRAVITCMTAFFLLDGLSSFPRLLLLEWIYQALHWLEVSLAYYFLSQGL